MNKLLELKKEYEEKLNSIKKIESVIAFIRLVFFLLAIILILVGYFSSINALYYVAGVCAIAFIVFVLIYSKYHKMDLSYDFRLQVIADYDKRQRGRWTQFKDGGAEFIDNDNYFESDLDLFGKASLFKYISVASTGLGRKALADALKDNDITKEEIKERQDAVLELSSDVDMNVDLISKFKKYATSSDDNKPNTMINALNNIENEVTYKAYMMIPSFVCTILLILSIVFSALQIINPIFIIIALIINYFVAKFTASKINEVRVALVPVNNVFYGYDNIILGITSYNYNSKLLNDIKSSLSNDDIKSLKKFNRIEPWISSGNNFLFKLIFNSLLGFDSYMLYLYARWQNKHSSHIREVVQNVSKMEVLLSLSTIGVINPNAVMPNCADTFEFEDLRHPLIKMDDVVPNSFKFDGMNIITGSNMSGKTTFMRTVGVSYILFKAGGFVVAKSFSAGIYKLFTSMKVVDDTSSGISTFYAEILRVKSIMEYAKKSSNMIVLIDEIFKGTNTIDRIKGATKVVEGLNKAGIYTIITTHDFELCDIDGVKNYHFLEHYSDNKIHFDYKIHEGKSNTTNAIYLLKMAGIIEE